MENWEKFNRDVLKCQGAKKQVPLLPAERTDLQNFSPPGGKSGGSYGKATCYEPQGCPSGTPYDRLCYMSGMGHEGYVENQILPIAWHLFDTDGEDDIFGHSDSPIVVVHGRRLRGSS